MSLAGAHVAAMVACTTLAHLAVLLGGELHPGCWCFAVASLLWPSWHATVGALGPRPAAAAAMAAVVLPAATYVASGAGPARAPAVATVALMGVVAARQASRQLPSHDLQLLMLSLLLTCAGALLNRNPSYALLLLPYAASGVFALMTRQLLSDLTNSAMGRGEPGEAARQLARRDIVTPRFVASVAALTCGIFAAAAVTFLCFPRLGLPAFAGAGARGLPRAVTLGAGSWTFDDGQVVARVFGLSAGDRAHGLYLRGRTYDELSPTGFHASLRPAAKRPLATEGPALRYEVVQNVAEEDPVLSLGPLRRGTVFTAANNVVPLVADVGGEAPYAAATAGSQRARLEGTQMADGARQRQRTAAAESAHNAAFRSHYLALPQALRDGLQPSLRAALGMASRPTAAGNGLAADAADDEAPTPALDPVAVANLLRQWLLANFVYDEAAPGAAEAQQGALLQFAGQNRRGNCTYFAATYAALLRLAGVPSRVVGGYAGGRWDEAGQVAVFTGSHAHAWVEWYLSGCGWVRDDATPGRLPEVLGGVAALRERLGRFWQLGVLQFNLGSQLDLWQRTRDGLGVLASLALPTAPREAHDAQLRHNALFWGATVAGVVAMLAAGASLGRFWAARRRQQLSVVLQATLERHLGRPLHAHETLRGAGCRLPAALDEATRALVWRAIEAHEATRFGRGRPILQVQALVQALRGQPDASSPHDGQR